jgi:hypothetical protein
VFQVLAGDVVTAALKQLAGKDSKTKVVVWTMLRQLALVMGAKLQPFFVKLIPAAEVRVSLRVSFCRRANGRCRAGDVPTVGVVRACCRTGEHEGQDAVCDPPRGAALRAHAAGLQLPCGVSSLHERTHQLRDRVLQG